MKNWGISRKMVKEQLKKDEYGLYIHALNYQEIRDKMDISMKLFNK